MENQSIQAWLTNLKSKAQLYSPGRYLIFTKDETDLTQGYSTSDILIDIVTPPNLSENMLEISEARYKSRFPNGVARAGEFPGMHTPYATTGVMSMPLFLSGFLDWNLTLPVGDEHDANLEAECMRPFFNIHHVPITADGYMIYVTRSKRRLSWHDTVLCTHSWGDDVDKDNVCQGLLKKLYEGQGEELFLQAREGVRREINPFYEHKDSSRQNELLTELLMPEDVSVLTANCLTIPAAPKDVGYHLGFTAFLNTEAGRLLEQRRAFPMVGRIAQYNSVKFTADSMAEWFERFSGKIAMTVEPVIIMACVQNFGEEFLKRLPVDVNKIEKIEF